MCVFIRRRGGRAKDHLNLQEIWLIYIGDAFTQEASNGVYHHNNISLLVDEGVEMPPL